MEQRKKIIIPIGVDPEETLAPPHFDAEATMTARPVVPLSQSQIAVDRSRRAQSATAAPAAWRRSSLLIIVIVAAASIGLAGGLAIGLYQRHQSAVAAQPAPASATNETQPAPIGKTTSDARKTPPPVETAKASEQPSPETKPADKSKPSVVNATNNDERDNQRENKRDEIIAPSPRDRNRDEVDDNIDREAKRDKRDRKEERRERRRQRDEDNVRMPQQIDRTVGRQVDRIRDIFEGRP